MGNSIILTKEKKINISKCRLVTDVESVLKNKDIYSNDFLRSKENLYRL